MCRGDDDASDNRKKSLVYRYTYSVHVWKKKKFSFIYLECVHLKFVHKIDEKKNLHTLLHLKGRERNEKRREKKSYKRVCLPCIKSTLFFSHTRLFEVTRLSDDAALSFNASCITPYTLDSVTILIKFEIINITKSFIIDVCNNPTKQKLNFSRVSDLTRFVLLDRFSFRSIIVRHTFDLIA